VTSETGPTLPSDDTNPLPTGAEPPKETTRRQKKPSPGPRATRQPTSPPPSSPPPSSPPPTSPPPTSPPPSSPPPGPEAGADEVSEADRVRAEIAQTRAELGETVEALSAKLDVKARMDEKKVEVTENVKAKVEEGVAVAKQQAAQLQAAATDEQGKPKPPAVGAAAGVGAGLVLLLLVRRRRRKRRRPIS
jgi:hypothetical protein